MKYLLLDAKGAITEVDGPMDVLDAQEVLDDDFEALQPSMPPPYVMLVAMNGKRKGMEANWLATRAMKHNMKPDDFIVGPAIVTGPPNAVGELTDVSDEVLAAFQERVSR